MSIVESRYHDASYLANNPDWDRKDCPWKADLVRAVLSDFKLLPSSVCEVGCGSGDVLVHLRRHYPATAFYGYDISPQAAVFWRDHEQYDIHFRQGDFFELNHEVYDVILMLDVIEHLRDPFTFLERFRSTASYFVFHIPLDLSAGTVLRGQPLMSVRSKVGHIHYFTKDLAILTLLDAGYEVLDWRYTGASLNMPNRSLKTLFAALPRRIAYALNKDLGVRLLGGETLLVLAKPSS